jgi:hypothetical protein
MMNLMNPMNPITQLMTVGTALAAAGMLQQTTPQPPADTVLEKQVVAHELFATENGKTSEVQVRVVCEDGREDIAVVLNGAEVDASQIVRKGGHIQILDKEGNEIHTFPMNLRVDIQPEVWMSDWQNQAQAWTDLDLTFADDNGLTWSMNHGETPKVMLGVHLDTPSEAVMYHLGLDRAECTMLSGIYEGLPAYEAGLRQYDIIVAIEGTAPAGPDVVRKVLHEREPGDEITLMVMQRGERNVVKVPLEAYDADRMMSSTLQGGSIPFPQPNVTLFRSPDSNTQVFGNMLQVDPRIGGRVFVGSDPDGIQGIYQLPGKLGQTAPFPSATAPGSLNQLDIERFQNEGKAHATNMADHLNSIDERIANLEKLLETLINTRAGGDRP